jgi:hypothetical protein
MQMPTRSRFEAPSRFITLSLARTLSRCIVVALGMAALTACHEGPAYGTRSSDSGSADALAHASPGPHYVCDVTFGAIVRSFESCCSAADKKAAQYAAETTGKPRASALGSCEQDLAQSDASQRIHIDAVSLAECSVEVAAYLDAAPQCWELKNRSERGVPPALTAASCKAAVVGLEAETKPCRRDYECSDGLTCVGWSIGSDGTCQHPPARGEACGALIGDAGDGSRADASASAALPSGYPFGDHPACAANGSCDEGRCHAPADADSDAGAFAREGDTCTADAECLDTLYCARTHADGGGPRYCMPRGLAGARCDLAGVDVDEMCEGICRVSSAHVATCVSFCGSR